jgi:hypothetical protein
MQCEQCKCWCTVQCLAVELKQSLYDVLSKRLTYATPSIDVASFVDQEGHYRQAPASARNVQRAAQVVRV